jgi:hypothetical protein
MFVRIFRGFNHFFKVDHSFSLLADLFLYSYESEFLQKLVKDKKIHEARHHMQEKLVYCCSYLGNL